MDIKKIRKEISDNFKMIFPEEKGTTTEHAEVIVKSLNTYNFSIEQQTEVLRIAVKKLKDARLEQIGIKQKELDMLNKDLKSLIEFCSVNS